jgi:hypothetical protein
VSALDTSVTLDEVFQVVHAKRVPVAAELAGYLALEIAEGASAGHVAAFEIDPRAVYIGDEGSVALVRPRQDTTPGGDTEASVRSLLARLLDASGSKTPALGQVASRPSGAGLGVLVEELENALIPVNRAAGRRALARLAREVKRVTHGVGRNAAVSVSAPRMRESEPMPAAAVARPRPPVAPAPPAPRDDIGDLLEQSAPPPFAAAAPPAPVGSPASMRVAPPPRLQPPAPVRPPPQALPPEPTRAGVDELLADFAVSGPHEDEAMARELKALVGLEPTPPPALSRATSPFAAPAPGSQIQSAPPAEFIPSSPPPPHVPTPPPPSIAGATPGMDDGGIEALLAETANLSPVHGGEQPVQLANPVTAQLPVARERARTRGAVPAREISRSLQDVTPKPRTDRLLLALALIIALAGGAAVWVYRPQLFAPKAPPTVDSSGNPIAAPPGSNGATANGAVEANAEGGAGIRPTRDGACRGSLAINDAPDGAEVLILEGQAPLDVGSMPVGARLEFVATHDGYAPKRTVVPADAQWDKPPADKADAGARYEVGVQLDPTKAKPGSVDPWPSAEPGTSVGGDGPPGVVHVASTPKGAEVWLLAGLGPATRIDQIRCDADVDVLVAGPTTFRQRLHASASDFAKAPATPGTGGATVRTVTLSAKQ